MKRKHKLSGRLAAFAGAFLETPSPCLPGGFYVTVTNRNEAYISGCEAIRAYDDGHILVDIKNGSIAVYGDGLDITRYSDSEITIRGEITCVRLGEESV